MKSRPRVYWIIAAVSALLAACAGSMILIFDAPVAADATRAGVASIPEERYVGDDAASAEAAVVGSPAAGGARIQTELTDGMQEGRRAMLQFRIMEETSDTPIAGVEVAAWLAGEEVEPEGADTRPFAVSDAEGAGRLAVPSGARLTIQLRMRREGALLERFYKIEKLKPDATEKMFVHVNTADNRHNVWARVVSAASQRPAAQARIYAFDKCSESAMLDNYVITRHANAEGLFRVWQFDDTRRFARIDAPPFASKIVLLSNHARTAADAPTAALAEGASLHLKVKTSNGRPARGVVMRISAECPVVVLGASEMHIDGWKSPDTRLYWHLKTSFSGEAEVQGIPAAAQVKIEYVDERASYEATEPLTLIPGEMRTLELTQLLGSIDGEAVDDHGRPAANIRLRLDSDDDTPSKLFRTDGPFVAAPMQTVTTDDEGKFSIAGLFPGNYYIGPDGCDMPKTGDRAPALVSQFVHLGGRESKHVSVEVSFGLYISGTLKADSGEPVADVTVRTNPGDYKAITDSSGRFTLGPLPRGRYGLHLPNVPHEFSGFECARSLVHSGESDANITLSTFRLAHGRINTSQGAIVAGRVMAFAEDLPDTEMKPRIQTSFIGSAFDLRVEQTGYYTIVVATSKEFGVKRHVYLSRSAETNDLAVDLVPAATIIMRTPNYQGRISVRVLVDHQFNIMSNRGPFMIENGGSVAVPPESCTVTACALLEKSEDSNDIPDQLQIFVGPEESIRVHPTAGSSEIVTFTQIVRAR